MRFQCPNCRKRLKVTPDQAGKRIKCPGCDLRFALPASLFENEPETEPAAPGPPANVPQTRPNGGARGEGKPVTFTPDASNAPESGDFKGVLISTPEGHRRIEARVKDHGVVRIALGATLLLIGVASLFLSRFFPWTLLASLVCLAQGGRELYWGINAYVSYIVPEAFPADIRRENVDGQDVVETLLLRRLITGTYLAPAGFLRKLAVAFAPRFRFLTPEQAPLFAMAGQICIAVAAAFLIIVVLTVAIGFYAVMIVALAVLCGGLAVSVIALRLCVPGERKPREDVIEEPKERRSFVTGNTSDLINHLTRDVFLAVREQERFNRELWPAPKIESGADFDVVIGQESEPLLVEESTDVPVTVPVLLERSGAGFVAGGWFFLFFLPSQIPFINAAASLPAIAVGWWFLALAFRMRNSFRFVSDVYRLELHGSSTAKQMTTEILGTGGTAQREQLHTSNVYWILHAARVVTECSMAARFDDKSLDPSMGTVNALCSPRYVIRVIDHPELRNRVQTMIEKLTNYKDVRERIDEEAAEKVEAQTERKALLEHQLQQERIKLEQQLHMGGELGLEKIRQQGRLQEKLLEKMLDRMDPEEIQRLAKEGFGSLQLAADQPPKLEGPRDDAQLPADAGEPADPGAGGLNGRLLDLLRRYLDKRNPADARLAAKDDFDQLVKDFDVPDDRVEQLRRLVEEELAG